MLIDAGADVDAIREKNGDTALFIAARKGYTNVVIELLDRNADFTIKNEDGDTAIDWAKTKGHKYIVDILKKAGAKPKSFFSYFR